MVKRIALIVLPLACLAAAPLEAQDFTQVEVALGYANWGAEGPNAQQTALESSRVSGFAFQMDYNLTSWFAIDNYLGAYSFPDFAGYTDWTAVYNVTGVKLTARDLLDGAISPYVVAGFGGGQISSNNAFLGRSSAAARYGGGVDFNLNPTFAFRIDATELAIGNTLFSNAWSSKFNLATSLVLKLGF